MRGNLVQATDGTLCCLLACKVGPSRKRGVKEKKWGSVNTKMVECEEQ
jgi:hypothetical protein